MAVGPVIIKINIHNLDKIQAAFRRAPEFMSKELAVSIRKTVLLIKGDAMRETPVKTGYLRSSYKTVWSPLRGEVYPQAHYALFVHEGTKAHVIEPRYKKALYWKGAAHPVARVNHPGFRANPYMQRAVDQAQKQVDAIFTEAVQNALDSVNKESQ